MPLSNKEREKRELKIKFIWIHDPQFFLFRSSDFVLIIKANVMHYFSDLFDKVLYMFRTVPLSIIRSNSTLYTRNM